MTSRAFNDMGSKQKERNQHIKVFTRVRPKNSLELHSHIVVDCVSSSKVTVKDKGQQKTFGFDRVFGPDSKQVDVYKAVVAPLISEVLQGYNCTVFAYGQTGTGKTYTMVGGQRTMNDPSGNWENDPSCGIVPRTLDHLFDELKVRGEEYSVRVSFLELYNEELCDLLASSTQEDSKLLRLYEDSMKKGSVIVSGLEERVVREKNDVYPILEAGSLRRQTAPTLMNAQSSRSHTIFTITVHVKMTTPEGDELFKTGKLNLVDLAGSENIGRSGAVEMRAREAGNINQSLLTLGRVITCLVERAPHVPYRESKLTRILQDSLGGRTKTSIIATVSPALCNLEETLSTFEYAQRARNITNKPEINQKTSKFALLKNYIDEIDRLRKELQAAREKHGVYLLSEDYNGLVNQIDNLNKELVNKIQLLKVREDEFAKQEDIMTSLNMEFQRNLQLKEAAVEEREKALKVLGQQAQLLLRTADEATEDSKRLHDRLDKARLVHTHNQTVVEQFKNRFCSNLNGMKGATQEFHNNGTRSVESLREESEAHADACRKHETALQELPAQFVNELVSQVLMHQFENAKPIFDQSVAGLRDIHDNVKGSVQKMYKYHEDCLSSQNTEWSSLETKVNATVELQRDLKSKLTEIGEELEESEVDIGKMSTDYLDEVSKEESELKELLFKKDAALNEMKHLIHHLAALDHEITAVKQRAAEVQKRQVTSNLSALHTRVQQLEDQLKDASELNEQLLAFSDPISTGMTTIRKNETKTLVGTQTIFTEDFEKWSQRCTSLAAAQENKTAALSTALESVQEGADNMVKNMELHRIEEEERLTEWQSKTRTAHRQLADSISEFCESTFANIHDRCNELKVHFNNELLRDEKTGNTPIRKDFQYPRRIITSIDRFQEEIENIPPIENNEQDC